jgi:histone H3/H4
MARTKKTPVQREPGPVEPTDTEPPKKRKRQETDAQFQRKLAKIQRSDKLEIQKRPFERLVREIEQDLGFGSPHAFSAKAIAILQSSTEYMLIEAFNRAAAMAALRRKPVAWFDVLGALRTMLERGENCHTIGLTIDALEQEHAIHDKEVSDKARARALMRMKTRKAVDKATMEKKAEKPPKEKAVAAVEKKKAAVEKKKPMAEKKPTERKRKVPKPESDSESESDAEFQPASEESEEEQTPAATSAAPTNYIWDSEESEVDGDVPAPVQSIFADVTADADVSDEADTDGEPEPEPEPEPAREADSDSDASSEVEAPPAKRVRVEMPAPAPAFGTFTGRLFTSPEELAQFNAPVRRPPRARQ